MFLSASQSERKTIVLAVLRIKHRRSGIHWNHWQMSTHTAR